MRPSIYRCRHFGVTLWWLWDHFGWLWGDFGVTLGSLWGHLGDFGVTLGLLFDPSGLINRKYKFFLRILRSQGWADWERAVPGLWDPRGEIQVKFHRAVDPPPLPMVHGMTSTCASRPTPTSVFLHSWPMNVLCCFAAGQQIHGRWPLAYL